MWIIRETLPSLFLWVFMEEAYYEHVRELIIKDKIRYNKAYLYECVNRNLYIATKSTELVVINKI